MWELKHRVPNSYFIINDYKTVIKVYEDYIESWTSRKHKKRRKTKKKLAFQKNK